MFLVFLYLEDKVATEPIIPVRLVAGTRTVLSACLTNWFSTMSSFIFLFYVPLYLQVRGLSPTQAGLRVIPFSALMSVGSLGGGLFMRATGRYYLAIIVMMVTFTSGAALTSSFDATSPSWTTFLFPAPIGLGYGGQYRSIKIIGDHCADQCARPAHNYTCCNDQCN